MNRDKKDVVRTLATIFFRDYGIKNVSMDDIAANCGISKRTLYGLFKNKKEIVSTIVQSEMERMTLDLSEINKTASNEVMEIKSVLNYVSKVYNSISPTLLNDLKKGDRAIHSDLVGFKDRTIKEFFVRNITDGKQEGFYKDTIDADEVAKSYLRILNTFFAGKLHVSDGHQGQTLEFINNLFVRRLVTEKADRFLTV